MKKLISVLLVAFLFTCLALNAVAAEPATLTVEKVSATEQTLTVNVVATDLTVASYGLAVTYNTDAVTLTGITAGDATVGSFSANPAVGMVAAANDTNYVANGVLFTLTFDVIDATLSAEIALVVDSFATADQDVVDVDVDCAHEWAATEVITAPTCSEEGSELYTCALCGQTKTEAIATTAHNYGEWVVTTEPTCEGDGQKTCTCLDCGHEETKKIDPLGHDWVEVVNEAEGLKFEECTRCGAVRNEQPLTGDATLAVIAVAVVSMGAALTTVFYNKRRYSK